jgi:Flp pilus assembly protein TadD
MAANLAPEKVQYWRSLGAAEYGLENYVESRNAYNKALELEPSHGNTLYNLALIALKQNDVDEALTRAAAAVRSDGSNAVYLYTLGQAAELAGLDEQAIVSYRKSASMDPGYSKPRINLGVLYNEKGEDDQAIEYLLQALKIEPDSSTVWNNLGKAYLHKGDYTNSLKCFEKAASSEPDDVELQMNLALALTESGENSRAETAYSRVISLEPGRGEAYDKLARLQFASGDTAGAAATAAALEKAVPGYPGLGELKALLQ